MGETISPTEGANSEPTPTPNAVSFTKDQVDSAAAAARREAEAKFKEVNDRLITFEAKEKERAELEMTDLEKANSTIATKDEEIADLNSYKDKWTLHEESLKAIIEEEIKDFSDDDKSLVTSLPLDKQMMMVGKLKTPSAAPEGASKLVGDQSNPTKEAILAMPNGPEKDAKWRKFRLSG